MAEDNALVSRAQTGDEQAFTDLVRDYHAFVYAIVSTILDNRQDVEEAVQDAFVNAYRGLSQLEDTAKFKGWLAEIARNGARDRLRKQSPETVPIDEVKPHELQTSDSVGAQLIRDEQRELIRRAIETLPEKDREIAQAYYLDGASYHELIHAHGLSYKAISFRLSRAKRILAKRLRRLLGGVFVSPATTLKKIYSGGLTTMKVGTVPKITIGVIALIALVYIGSQQLMSPKEDAALSVQAVAPSDEAPAGSSVVVNPSLGEEVATSSPEVEPQLSAEEMDQVEDFFAQLEADDAQSEETLPADTDERGNTDAAAFDIDDGQSPEDVMNAYVEAYRNADFEALLPLLTGAAREGLESALPLLRGELPEGFLDSMADHMPEGISEELADDALEIAPDFLAMMRETMRKMFSGVEVLGSEYVGDEFHFQLRTPIPELSELIEMPDMSDLPGVPNFELPEMPDIPENIDNVHKMRKEDGEWLIYE